jgi:hypothetical protein
VTVAAEDVRSLRETSPAALSRSFNDCVEGEVTVGDRAVHLLSLERLLLEKERQCVAEFQAIEEARLSALAPALALLTQPAPPRPPAAAVTAAGGRGGRVRPSGTGEEPKR